MSAEPDVDRVHTLPELAAAFDGLRRPLSYGDLDRAARALPARDGRRAALPRGTLSDLLGATRASSRETVVTFLAACGLDEQSRRPWLAAPAADCRLPAPAGIGNEHEGPTDYTRWLRPQGALRAVVLFVDFPDVAGEAHELSDRTDLLQPEARDWFTRSSYGRVSLDVVFTTTWHRMPRPQTDYVGYGSTFEKQRAYLQDAVTATTASVDFRQVQLVYVIPPAAAWVFANSPTFIASPGWGVFADGVELRHGVTFGFDLGTWGFKVVNHETGHTFGLPDLYSYAGGPNIHAAAGGWDMMGLISGPAPDYLAWHKWKLGWLSDSQVYCMTARGQTTKTLTPPGASGGLKAFVVRTGPQRALVVENRQVSMLDVESDCFLPGVVVYSVDASVGGGANPIRVIDRTPGLPMSGCATDHADLDNAALTAVGHEVVDSASGARVRLTGSSGNNRTVRVTW